MSDDTYQITIVKYGTRQGTKSDVYLNYHIYGQPDEPIGMDYFFWVIRNRERTILLDTGFSQQGGANRKRTFLIDVADAYAALGIDTTAPHQLIVSHAHYDHIGNVTLFPNAQIIMSEAEYEFWTSEYGQRAQFRYSTEDEEIEALRIAHEEGRISGFSGTHELAPGVELIEVGGHTPGQVIVKVNTGEGAAILASDAVHYYEEYEKDYPFAFVADLKAMYQGFDRIRELMTNQATHLVSGHDPDTLNRFTPVNDGPLAGIAATIGTLD